MRAIMSRKLALILVSIVLAGPATAATLTVNSTANTIADDGLCTLHEAIEAANTDTASGASPGECAAGSGNDTIEFSVAGTIQPDGALPDITTVIHVDGYSAPGAAKNTLPLEQGTNAVLVIEIDGVNAGNVPGLKIDGSNAAGTIIEGLVINSSANPVCCNHAGIEIRNLTGGPATIIRGNFLATDTTGSQRRPRGSRSLLIWQGSSNVVVGSDTGGEIVPAERNLISGTNANGVEISGASNISIRGNLIGTNASGTAPLTNNNAGVFADFLTDGVISDNILSGNNSHGLGLRTANTVLIERNRVGTNAAGDAALPNHGGGIHVYENPNFTTANINVDINDNLVTWNNCFNCSGGIVVGLLNAASSTQAIRLSRNRVFANMGLEIDLATPNVTNNGLVFGLTPNDPDDTDTGPNTLQNFPELSAAGLAGDQLTVDVSFDSEASKSFTFEFFQASECDDSGHGGAEVFLGDAAGATDPNGDYAGQVVLTLQGSGNYVTATATNTENGTSEFSACLNFNEFVFEDGFENLP